MTRQKAEVPEETIEASRSFGPATSHVIHWRPARATVDNPLAVIKFSAHPRNFLLYPTFSLHMLIPQLISGCSALSVEGTELSLFVSHSRAA